MIPFTINSHGQLFSFRKPVVMGIINLNADSFYEGSRHQGMDEILRVAGKHLREGAGIIDLGVVSTRPGATACSEEEETRQLIPALKAVLHEFPGTLVSVDTFRAGVAREAFQNGAGLINDISGGEMDPAMIPWVLQNRIPYILMHMQGTPPTMQQNPQYENVVQQVMQSLIRRAAPMRKAGHPDLILDPGFGFGKTTEHNFELLKNLDILTSLGYPVLAGLSRKSMIWRTLGTSPAEALNGTTALNIIALTRGASILRVHDVKEAAETIKLFERL